MSKNKRIKTVGVLGGMGPEATVDLMSKIIKSTPVKVDQDHLRILVDNNPQIPCRVKAILEGGEDPSSYLLGMALNLERWGADFLVIPCNTAHFYVDKIEEVINIPIVNMVEETVKKIKRDAVRNVTLFASTALIRTGLYQNLLKKEKVNLTLPNEGDQQKLMEAIFNVKSGKLASAKLLLAEILTSVTKNESDSIILGCSELPIILEENKCSLPFYDPTQILARAVVQFAMDR
jgi:aspartate racemase